MTRTTIKTLNRAGTDPETGRECRPLTPQIVEKIEEYKRGHRPKQITSNDPTFFDPTTGEPIVWYAKNDRGQLELFDLMGFHPQSGRLFPVARDVVELWKQQAAKVVRRVPVRVEDPEKYGFLDPTTGSAKVWYSRNDRGEYEFYDGPGFKSADGRSVQARNPRRHRRMAAAAGSCRFEKESRAGAARKGDARAH